MMESIVGRTCYVHYGLAAWATNEGIRGVVEIIATLLLIGAILQLVVLSRRENKTLVILSSITLIAAVAIITIVGYMIDKIS